jgi:hypothetical protein
LAIELQPLREHIRLAYATSAERLAAEEFVTMGELILQAFHSRKKPLVQAPSVQAIEQDQQEPDYSAREFHDVHIDASASRMVDIATKKIHLTPDLVTFEIRVLEKVMEWVTKDNNVIGFSWLSEIGEELAARKLGEDTYLDPTAPVKRGRGRPRKIEQEPSYPSDEQIEMAHGTGPDIRPDIAPDALEPVDEIQAPPILPTPIASSPADTIAHFRKMREDSQLPIEARRWLNEGLK